MKALVYNGPRDVSIKEVPDPKRRQGEPGQIVSHELSLAAAPDAHEKLDDRVDGWTKVVLHPAA